MEAMEKAAHDGQVVEVTEKAKRRQYTAVYKMKILQEADACSKQGELGALLRREGLYSSHLAVWRKARDQGQHKGLEAKRRGPAPKIADARDQKIAEQERELRQLRARAELAEALVEVQKKVAVLLGIKLGPNGERL